VTVGVAGCAALAGAGASAVGVVELDGVSRLHAKSAATITNSGAHVRKNPAPLSM
jgi:hypothetical protein